jgi:uncharacterized membrane protein YuzA (DUF378 family)
MEVVDRFGGDATYYKKLAFKMAMVLVIVGALNWFLVGAFRFNLVEYLFGRKMLARSIYVLVGLAAIGIMFDRDTYLPFLGPMHAPCSVLRDRTPSGATRSVTVRVTPGAKVLYWAAEPSKASEDLKKIVDWKQAYAAYDNAGVVTAGPDGNAVLKVREPQPYTVPIKGALQHHVHYRVCGEAGWMSRIQTVFLD